jgi:glutamate N-acetyltransferase/amino-acid N-acetyltransferase
LTAGAFFNSRWVDAPSGTIERDPAVLAEGFRAGGVGCGLKSGGTLDLGIIRCDASEVSSAVMLTDNAAAAAPIWICRDELDRDSIAGVVVNSGNANAATGPDGLDAAREVRATAAEALGLPERSVAIAQTGVIGVPLDTELVTAAIPALAGGITVEGGVPFSEAILTTDDGPKRCSVTCDGVTVSGQAKGAGMIQPGFATMLCFVQTDAVIEEPDAVLRAAVDPSFARISVDGQSSTNDTVVLQASGRSGRPLPEGLLEAVMLQLALMVVADGEGATRICRVDVTGASSPSEAESVARAIGNSPLVKTALLGRDPNWGRIVQAAGAALPGEDLGHIGSESIDAVDLAAGGQEAGLAIDLERGEHSDHLYFCDLTNEYIAINSEYTT